MYTEPLNDIQQILYGEHILHVNHYSFLKGICFGLIITNNWVSIQYDPIC